MFAGEEIMRIARRFFIAGLISAMAGAAPGFAQTLGEVETRANVDYGRHDGEALLGDAYMPKAPGKYPAVITVHGGGWQGGAKSAYRFWGPWLAQRGYVVFSIDYRLVKPGKKMFPESVQDVRAAVQFMRSRAAEFKVDPDRIALMGDSAGAHLAALVALGGDAFANAYQDDPYAAVSAKVKAVIPVYGVFDMAQQWDHDLLNRPGDNIAEKYLGAPPSTDRKLYFDGSPLSYAVKSNSSVSVLLANGTEDDVVDRAQTDAFFLALKQSGNFVRRYVMQGAGHYWLTDPIDEAGSYAGLFAPRLLRFLGERL
jgi:acetyl esterase/lipase